MYFFGFFFWNTLLSFLSSKSIQNRPCLFWRKIEGDQGCCFAAVMIRHLVASSREEEKKQEKHCTSITSKLWISFYYMFLIPTLEGPEDAAPKPRLPPTTKPSPRIAGHNATPPPKIHPRRSSNSERFRLVCQL